jgi:hypothetical protein
LNQKYNFKKAITEPKSEEKNDFVVFCERYREFQSESAEIFLDYSPMYGLSLVIAPYSICEHSPSKRSSKNPGFGLGIADFENKQTF